MYVPISKLEKEFEKQWGRFVEYKETDLSRFELLFSVWLRQQIIAGNLTCDEVTHLYYTTV